MEADVEDAVDAAQDEVVGIDFEGMLLSASRVKQWMDCPLQAHFHYDLKLDRINGGPAAFGNCIHHVLEWLNYYPTPFGDDVEAKAINKFLYHWNNPESLGLIVDYYPPRTSFNHYRDVGIKVIKDVVKRHEYVKRTLIGTEIHFVVPFGAHRLTGKIDLLEVRGNTKGNQVLRIIDYKGGGKAPTKAELAMDVQFTIYDYAVSCPEFWIGDGTPQNPGIPHGADFMEAFFDLPRVAIWYHLRGQNGPKEIDAGPRDEVDYRRLYKVAEQIERAIEKEVFVPKIGDACSRCDYRNHCGLEIPVDFEERITENPHRWL